MRTEDQPSRAERKLSGEISRGERSAIPTRAERKHKKAVRRTAKTPAKKVFTPRGALPGTTRGKAQKVYTKSARGNGHFEKEMPEFPMRLNKYVAYKHDMTRGQADELIAAGVVRINGKTAALGDSVRYSDNIEIVRVK